MRMTPGPASASRPTDPPRDSPQSVRAYMWLDADESRFGSTFAELFPGVPFSRPHCHSARAHRDTADRQRAVACEGVPVTVPELAAHAHLRVVLDEDVPPHA